MKVVIGGASGFIGQALAGSLRADGHEVVGISRRPGPGAVSWEDVKGAVDGADAVVNLAGASIGGRRWTAARKEAIRSSRVGTNRVLAEAIQAAERRPGVLVTPSGVDYYGRSGDEVVDESSPPGDTYLARVSVDWEAAAAAAPTRHVALRQALVIGRGAPAVRLMALPFRAFVGGPVGGGRQWFPWIALDDLIGLYRLAIEGGLEGPVNAVAPEQLRQRDAARDFGAVLHRPSWLPAPAFAVRLALGEQADLLLHGQRAVSGKLDGFAFRYRSLQEALAEILTPR